MRLALVTLLFTFAASAQSFEQMTALRLHETPMGARTTAMGNSTEALNPDGTDLASNPSLLASLKNVVVSVSGAQDTFRVMRFNATPNTFFFDSQGRDARALTHLAAVIPVHGFVIGMYARQDPTLRDSVAGIQSPIVTEYLPQCPQEPCEYAYGVNPADFEHRDRRYGMTAAMERGAFSFGLGAELQQLDENYSVWRLGLGSQLPFMERVTRRASARKVVPNAGLRWRVSQRLAVAAAYNGAAGQTRTEAACLGDWSQNTCISNTALLPGGHTISGADAYRASVTFAPVQNVTVVAEGVRRNYSQVESDAVFVAQPNEDVTEWHAGAEYRFSNLPVSIRAGFWREPAKVAGNNYSIFGPDEETIDHRTIGAGIDVGRGTRIDVAYDDADGPSPRRAIIGVAFRTGH